MRSALLLLGGLVLVGAGIAVLALGVTGALVLGPGLILGGLLVKTAGLLVTGDPGPTPPAGSGRTVTTLGTASPDRARSGASTARTSALRRVRTARATARATEAARETALAAPRHAARPGPGRRAS